MKRRIINSAPCVNPDEQAQAIQSLVPVGPSALNQALVPVSHNSLINQVKSSAGPVVMNDLEFMHQQQHHHQKLLKKQGNDGAKRQRMEYNKDPSDLEGWTGPWGRPVPLSDDSDSEQAHPVDDHEKLLQENNNEEEESMPAEDDKEERRKLTKRFFEGEWLSSVPRYLLDFASSDGIRKCYIPKKQIHTYSGTGGVSKLLFLSPTCHLLLVGYKDGSIRLWDLYHRRALLKEYRSPSYSQIVGLCYSGDGERFWSLQEGENLIREWDTLTGALIDSVEFDLQLTYLVSYGKDKVLLGDIEGKRMQFDIETKDITNLYDYDGKSEILDLQVSKDAEVVVSFHSDQTVRINGKILDIHEFLKSKIVNMCLDRNGSLLALQMEDDQLFVFDISKIPLTRPRRFLGHKTQSPPFKPSFSSDGRFLMIGNTVRTKAGDKHEIVFWNAETCKLESRLPTEHQVDECIWNSCDVKKMVSYSKTGDMTLWQS